VRNGLVLRLSGDDGVDRVTSAHPSLNVLGIFRYLSFLAVLVKLPFEAIPTKPNQIKKQIKISRAESVETDGAFSETIVERLVGDIAV
jgi:hypothetical protein